MIILRTTSFPPNRLLAYHHKNGLYAILFLLVDISKELCFRHVVFSEQVVLFDSITTSIIPLDSTLINTYEAKQRVLEKLSDNDTINNNVEGWYDIWNQPFSAPNVRENVKSDRKNMNSRYHFYGCLQSLMKMHPSFDEVIVEVCSYFHILMNKSFQPLRDQILRRDPVALVFLLYNNKQTLSQVNIHIYIFIFSFF